MGRVPPDLGCEPATGKWTVETIRGWSHHSICEAHNAALAAERYERLCGQKNHNRELAGEWTEGKVFAYFESEDFAGLAKAINAALDAERDVSRAERNNAVKQLTIARQLRAELADAAGEWTSDGDDLVIGDSLRIRLHSATAKAISDAHNAALAVRRNLALRPAP
jgi:hypothetical protein